jgi:hypothetical protein
LVRIYRTDLDLVFVYMIAMRTVQMTVVQVVYVAAMLNCGVSAAWAMLMLMVGVMRFVACTPACWPHQRPPVYSFIDGDFNASNLPRRAVARH